MIDPLPGAAPYPAELQTRLAAVAEARRAAGQPPRTHHLAGDGRPRFTNRLSLETSPYLLQHAHNPVAWWPWCDEAFAEARRLGRPVFLSVGYSTCHWCHVMERESFEDEEVAAYLNAHYVPIKVDREERPDVDAVYMTAVQALTGGGGWPMSVWLDAERVPFFGGTYFPARDGDRPGARGFLSILGDVSAVWDREPERVRAASGALGQAVRAALAEAAPRRGLDLAPGGAALALAVRQAERLFDPVHGGAARAPKFPSSFPVRLLLRWHRRTGDEGALRMALLTLERMAAGGLMDQVGGGFHRYSTDARWLVPHFEKMLYDNALLATAYLEAWQASGRRDLGRVARQTLDYVLRELGSPEGGFFAAADADSEGEEGRFFVWDEAELRAVLGDDAERFIGYHGVTPDGNFEGRNVLWVPRPDEDVWEALAPARERLLAVRARRPAPLRDDKILTAWNGLAIGALARAGRALDEARYLAAAERAAAFILDRMRPGGRLARTYAAGRCGPPGFLADHAFLAAALLDLHEATLDPAWLEAAVALAEETERLFADPRGGWFVAGSDQELLFAREKPTHDGAEPSGASVATLSALRLEALRGDGRFGAVAERALRWYAPVLEEQPLALSELLLALDAREAGLRDVVLVWPPGGDPAALLAPLRRAFMPEHVLTGAAEGPPLERLARAAPVVADRAAAGGRPTAFVCAEGACGLPATTPEALVEQLRAVRLPASG